MDFCKEHCVEKQLLLSEAGLEKSMLQSAQILVDKFGVDTLINTGIAGSLDANMISRHDGTTDAVEHDMDASIFGDPIGQVQGWIHFRFRRFGIGRKAKAANEEANPDIHTFVGRIVSGRPVRVFRGGDKK